MHKHSYTHRAACGERNGCRLYLLQIITQVETFTLTCRSFLAFSTRHNKHMLFTWTDLVVVGKTPDFHLFVLCYFLVPSILGKGADNKIPGNSFGFLGTEQCILLTGFLTLHLICCCVSS